MANFYTNVACIGDNIFARVFENGKRKKFKVKYQPTLYAISKKQTKFQTLDKRFLEPIVIGSIKETREYLKQYKDVPNFEIFGHTQFQYPWISDNFPEENIEYDMSKLIFVKMDIECECEHGFPSIENPIERINAITLKVNKKKFVFGLGKYTPTDPNVQYFGFDDEAELLKDFLDLWSHIEPDVVTGWNCIPTNSNIWTKNKIVKISNIKKSDILFNSKVIRKFPITKKQKYNICLENGIVINSSIDHIFPYISIPKGKYSSLQFGIKEQAIKKENSLKFIIKELPYNQIFLEVYIQNNLNKDYNISDEALYCLGAIYTDGTANKKNKNIYGATFYNNDKDMLYFVKSFFDKQKRVFRKGDGIKKNGKNCYSTSTWFSSYNELTNFKDWIFSETGQKCLSVEKFSQLSTRQFMIFVSGCIDGDGEIWDTSSIGFVNYSGDIGKFEELLRWNGIFSIIESKQTRLRIPFNKDNFKILNTLDLKIKYKKENLKKLIPFEVKKSSSNNISWRKFSDNSYLVKINSINKINQLSEMIDIETDTSYFLYSGVKTHNCKAFDIPYLVARITRLLGEDEPRALSPWKIISAKTANLWGQSYATYDIIGVAVIDYYQIYQKYQLEPRESYRLDHIAEIELGKKKVSYKEYENYRDFYKQDFQKFIEYNIIDVDLVDELEDKLKFIELTLEMAYFAKINYEDVISQVRTWDNIIYNYLRRKGIVIPLKTEHHKDTAYAGAYVKDPPVGLHKWVVSLDVTSLYPSEMRVLNIGTETKIGKYDNIRQKLLDNINLEISKRINNK